MLTWKWTGWDLNPWPVNRKCIALPLSQHATCVCFPLHDGSWTGPLANEPRVGPGAIPSPPYSFTSPPSTLSFSIFSLSYSLHLFSCFSIAYHSTRIVPLHFQAECRRRRLNLALVFLCVLILLYVLFSLQCMLVFVVFDLVLYCGVIVVSPCCRR